MTENLNGDLEHSHSGKQEEETLMEKLVAVGVTPEIVESYFQVLRQFFAGKLAKYHLEEKLKSFLSPQAVKVHNQVFVQVLQQAQQGGNTQVPSLSTHEKDSKYVKRRLLVKRPIKSLTCWNEESNQSTNETTSRKTLKRKRNNSTKNKTETVVSSPSKTANVSSSLGVENKKKNKSDYVATSIQPSLDRKGDIAWYSREYSSQDKQDANLPFNWKDAIREQSLYRVGKRMKEIGAQHEMYQIEKESIVGLFHALEFHLLDIIKGTREQFHESNLYRPSTLSIRDLFHFTEYAQDILGDPYSMDRTSLAFSIF